MKRIRPSGPGGVARPYMPLPPTDEADEQAAQALDQIAVSLASIDHNLEQLVFLLRNKLR
jgi:hypothetical protein